MLRAATAVNFAVDTDEKTASIHAFTKPQASPLVPLLKTVPETKK